MNAKELTEHGCDLNKNCSYFLYKIVIDYFGFLNETSPQFNHQF